MVNMRKSISNVFVLHQLADRETDAQLETVNLAQFILYEYRDTVHPRRVTVCITSTFCWKYMRHNEDGHII